MYLSHTHWVARQNKLEIPRDKDEVNKREIHEKPTYECRCDGRLQTKTKRFTRLSYTGLVVELEHLKIKTKLTNEKFASVKGECEI